jgi:hypothetical protein
MLRIVLPAVSAPAIDLIPVASVNPVAALNVRVLNEVVIHVDIDIVVAPATAPAASTPRRSDHHPYAE